MFTVTHPTSLLKSLFQVMPHSVRCHLLYVATNAIDHSPNHGRTYAQHKDIDITFGFYIALTQPKAFNTLDKKIKHAIYKDNIECIELITQHGYYADGLTDNILITTNFDGPRPCHSTGGFEGITCRKPKEFNTLIRERCDITPHAADLLRMLNIFATGTPEEARQLKQALFQERHRPNTL